jgi:hypothetical protein
MGQAPAPGKRMPGWQELTDPGSYLLLVAGTQPPRPSRIIGAGGAKIAPRTANGNPIAPATRPPIACPITPAEEVAVRRPRLRGLAVVSLCQTG